MMDKKFEMVPCPVCGKPMPKKRLELGYNYCVNCSTEKPKVCIVEGTQEGDMVQSEVVIMTSQEAQAVLGAKVAGLNLDHIEDEVPVNTQTYEEQEELERIQEQKDLDLLEGEFGYDLSDKVGQELEDFGNLSDDDLGSEIVVREE